MVALGSIMNISSAVVLAASFIILSSSSVGAEAQEPQQTTQEKSYAGAYKTLPRRSPTSYARRYPSNLTRRNPSSTTRRYPSYGTSAPVTTKTPVTKYTYNYTPSKKKTSSKKDKKPSKGGYVPYIDPGYISPPKAAKPKKNDDYTTSYSSSKPSSKDAMCVEKDLKTCLNDAATCQLYKHFSYDVCPAYGFVKAAGYRGRKRNLEESVGEEDTVEDESDYSKYGNTNNYRASTDSYGTSGSYSDPYGVNSDPYGSSTDSYGSSSSYSDPHGTTDSYGKTDYKSTSSHSDPYGSTGSYGISDYKASSSYSDPHGSTDSYGKADNTATSSYSDPYGSTDSYGKTDYTATSSHSDAYGSTDSYGKTDYTATNSHPDAYGSTDSYGTTDYTATSSYSSGYDYYYETDDGVDQFLCPCTDTLKKYFNKVTSDKCAQGHYFYDNEYKCNDCGDECHFGFENYGSYDTDANSKDDGYRRKNRRKNRLLEKEDDKEEVGYNLDYGYGYDLNFPMCTCYELEYAAIVKFCVDFVGSYTAPTFYDDGGYRQLEGKDGDEKYTDAYDNYYQPQTCTDCVKDCVDHVFECCDVSVCTNNYY